MARLESGGLRRALLARLGPEAGDAIDEFLSLALAYEASETPSLQGFLHWLRISDPEVKRDMEQERDEVRVMTVHGSKGLEANIVFLADTCSARGASRGGLVGLTAPAALRGVDTVPAWLLPGSQLVPQIRDACDAVQRRDREEYQRLLYVAMTRARDRLYVAGFEGTQKRDKGCWYDLISEGLDMRLSEATDGLGGPVRRMDCPQTAPVPERPPKVCGSPRRRRPIGSKGRRPRPHVRCCSIRRGWSCRITASRRRPHWPARATRRCCAAARYTACLSCFRRCPRVTGKAPARAFSRRRRGACRKDSARRCSPPCSQFSAMRVLARSSVRAARLKWRLAAELPPRSPGEPHAIISGQVDRLVCGKDRDFRRRFQERRGGPGKRRGGSDELYRPARGISSGADAAFPRKTRPRGAVLDGNATPDGDSDRASGSGRNAALRICEIAPP